MNASLLEIEGTWEDIAARAPDFVGRRLRVLVLPDPTPAADPLLQLLGSIASPIDDVAARHDKYLGQALAGEGKAHHYFEQVGFICLLK